MIKALAAALVIRSVLGYAGPLDFNCTDPELSVSYEDSINKYSGHVTCGNLLLSVDLDTAPTVKFTADDADGMFTVAMIDPDGNINGSWPGESGDHAPVRHWVVGNVAASQLKSGFSATDSGFTTVTTYKAPAPMGGSHRYGFFLFAQPDGEIDFEVLDDNDRIAWNYTAWMEEYGLGDKTASNFMIVQLMTCDLDPLACY